jgi:transforming growth factor-beta-induced protein
VRDFVFPDFVEVILTSGATRSVPVTWEAALEQFDPTRLGTQTIRGRFLLDGIENPNQLRPSVAIELQAVDWLTTLEKTPDYQRFYQAFIKADIDLTDHSSFTIFAPTNQAFDALLGFLNLSFEELLESDTLETVIRYHILEGTYSAQALLAESPNLIPTVLGTPLTLDFDGEFITINVINRIIRASDPNTDQTIHRIDGVLLPPNTFAGDLQSVLNQQALNLFVDLLGDADINITQLLASGFTLFAPNQSAFEAYAADQGLTLAELIASPALGDILLYHIVADRLSADQLIVGAPMTLESLNGQMLDVTFEDGVLKVNGVAILASDNPAALATLHTIGEVLTPPQE